MKLIKIVTLLAVCLILVPFNSQAQKKQKEKKPFVWELPKLTGNDDFDRYLLTCDTLYTRIQSYNDSITYYKVEQAPTGEVDDAGKPLYKYKVVDNAGNTYNTLKVVSQYADFILAGTNILLDCTNLTLLTATATTSLPSLGLNAFSYGKYVKSGPQIVSLGGKEVKEIISSYKSQAKAIQTLKKSSTNTGENKDVVMISSQVPDGIDIIERTSDEFDATAAVVISDDDIKNADMNFDDIFNSEI